MSEELTDREKVLDWCRLYCNDSTLEDEAGFSYVVDNVLDLIKRAGVSSESLGGMSQTFSKETALSLSNLLSPYKRLRTL